MTGGPGVRNQASGELSGAIVQAGTIQQVSLAAAPRTGSAVVPRQLPLAVRDFIGRAEHLAALDALLPGDEDVPGDTGAVPPGLRP